MAMPFAASLSECHHETGTAAFYRGSVRRPLRRSDKRVAEIALEAAESIGLRYSGSVKDLARQIRSVETGYANEAQLSPMWTTIESISKQMDGLR